MLSLSSLSQEAPIEFSTHLYISKHQEQTTYKEHFKEADNEVKLAYAGLFVFYKHFISSQDGSTCSFTPSCSEYAIQSIKKFGVIKGAVSFFDRYSRCNSLSPGLYSMDRNKKRLKDEVGDF